MRPPELLNRLVRGPRQLDRDVHAPAVVPLADARVLRLADTSQCAAATQLYRETERGKVGRNAAFDAAAEERYWQKG